MKHTLTLSFFIFSLFSQAQSLQPSVFASAGGSVQSGDVNLSWTLGEAVVSTLSSDGVILTQGFHQPLLEVSTGFTDPTFDYDIHLYPNPVQYELSIDTEFDRTLQYTLSNMEGRIMARRKFVGEDKLDLSRMSPGTYAVYFFRGHKIVKALLIEKK